MAEVKFLTWTDDNLLQQVAVGVIAEAGGISYMSRSPSSNSSASDRSLPVLKFD
jgi:hypothetical protein